MENEKIKLNLVVLWKLVAWRTMQSNSIEDGKHEYFSLFYGKEVLSNTPFTLRLVLNKSKREKVSD